MDRYNTALFNVPVLLGWVVNSRDFKHTTFVLTHTSKLETHFKLRSREVDCGEIKGQIPVSRSMPILKGGGGTYHDP